MSDLTKLAIISILVIIAVPKKIGIVTIGFVRLVYLSQSLLLSDFLHGPF